MRHGHKVTTKTAANECLIHLLMLPIVEYSNYCFNTEDSSPSSHHHRHSHRRIEIGFSVRFYVEEIYDILSGEILLVWRID